MEPWAIDLLKFFGTGIGLGIGGGGVVALYRLYRQSYRADNKQLHEQEQTDKAFLMHLLKSERSNNQRLHKQIENLQESVGEIRECLIEKEAEIIRLKGRVLE